MNVDRQIAPKSLPSIVAENIRAEAGRRGLKQSDLARELLVSHGTINMRWSGRRKWSLSDIEQVADVFGIEPHELLIREK